MDFRWVTQIRVRYRQGGIADLLLLVGGKEAIVIESKIGAMVSTHEDDLAVSTDSEENAEPLPDVPVANTNQLSTYGDWLAGRCKDRLWPGVLVLITHYSKAPLTMP
jgi:hypothetical protein